MSVFWVNFWIVFLLSALVYRLTRESITGGYEKDTSHYWAMKGSQNKYRDASVREVWQHNNPGKSYEAAQERDSNIVMVILLIGVAVGIGYLSAYLFKLPPSDDVLYYFYKFGSGLLGAAAGTIFFLLLFWELDHFDVKALQVINRIIVWLLSIAIIALAVLAYFGKAPDRWYYYLWIPVGGCLLLWPLQKLFTGISRRGAVKGGSDLSNWVNSVVYILRAFPSSVIAEMAGNESGNEYSRMMSAAMNMLQTGWLDSQAKDKDFHRGTEKAMLSLLSGKRLVLQDRDMVQAQYVIIKAVQVFYLYSAEHFNFPIHPKVRAALQKK